MLTYEEYLEKNYNLIRSEYESMLVEQGYSPRIVSEVDDGWIEYCDSEYIIYLENLE